MKKLYLGIDFGTSNTSISYLNKTGNIKVLKYNNSSTIPSIISFNDEIKCGIHIDKKNILREFKIEILNKDFNFMNMNINQILVIYFKGVKGLIISKLGNYKNMEIIASVPSEFNDSSRKLIKKCYEQAGFTVKRLINEPTAAALSFGLENTINDEKILVVDIGGGTSDFSILEIDDGFFEVIDNHGLNEIGGKTINQKLEGFLKKKLKKKYNYDHYNIELIKRKINLIKRYTDEKIKLTYKDFEKIILDIIIRYEDIFNLIKSKHEIKKIIMVGGGSNLYIIHELVTRIFGNIVLENKFLNSCVAKGCCYYLGNLNNLLSIKNDITIVDVNPLSLGVELTNGNFSIIIPKNTPIPTSMTQRYTLDKNDLDKIIIKVYQGERKLASDNVMVGKIEYFIKSKTVNPIISITFKLTSDSMILITVVDETNNSKFDYSLENKIDYNFVDKHLELSLQKYHEDIINYKRNEKIYLARMILDNKLNNINNNLSLGNLKKNELLEINFNLLETLEKLNNSELDNIINNNLNHQITSKNDNISQADVDEEIKKEIIKNRTERVNKIINELLLLQDKSEEENNFLYTATDILQTINHTSIDLDNIINTYDFLKRKDYKKELEYLIKYLKSNILDFDLSLKKQMKIKIFLEKCEIDVIQNKEYKKYIKKINNFCEKIYNNIK